MPENKNDFTQGSILSKLLRFMIPILGALVLQAMYGAVDILVVGRFGTTAGISGVSMGSSIVNLVTFTITGLTMGVTVVMGQYFGEKKPDKVGQVCRMRCGYFYRHFILCPRRSACRSVLKRWGSHCPCGGIFERLCAGGGCNGNPVQFYRLLQRTFQDIIRNAAGYCPDLYRTSAHVLFHEHPAGCKSYHDWSGSALRNHIWNCDQSFILYKSKQGSHNKTSYENIFLISS